MSIIDLKLKSGKVVRPHKAVISAQYDTKNILTHSPWEYVALWLKRKKNNDAQIFWNQAREFHRAAAGVSLQSAPLLHYYSFLNATKALLAANKVVFDEHHGVSEDKKRRRNSKAIKLSNEGVKIRSSGILPSLSAYFSEEESRNEYSLKEILFNLPYIHRSYCLTYRSQRDMFVPLKNGRFVVNTTSKEAFFTADISNNFSLKKLAGRLPASFILDSFSGSRSIRSTSTIQLKSARRVSHDDLKKITLLNSRIRKDIEYINATETLWYLKLEEKDPKKIARTQLTLTLAAMHRLSELCRYRPVQLSAFMSSQENWLLSEFINSSPNQYIDMISSEMTGLEFLIPNIRPAS
jgi:hypothetical protein